MTYQRCDVPYHDGLEGEVKRLRAVLRELERRCEQVAKVTEDPDVYDLLNDAGWKAEEYVRWASMKPEDA